MQKSKITVIALLIIFSVFNLYAQNPEELNNTEEKQISNELTVKKINFTGLKKTKNFYIQSKVKKYLNVPVKDFDMHGLETTLQLEGLFDDIQISMNQTGEETAGVDISVKEKITFIPLPFAMYSSSGFMAGAMIMDTNAFGIKDSFMLGGFYASSSLTGLMMFSSPPREHGIPGLSLYTSFSKNTSEIENLDQDTVLKYDYLNFYSNLSITEQFFEYNSVSINGYFNFTDSDKADDYEKVDSLKCLGTGLSYAFSKSDWNGWFMSTNSLGASAGITLYSSKSDYKYARTVSVNLRFQKPVIERLRLYSASSALYGKDQHIAFYSGGGAGSVSILPGSFKTQKIAGGNAGLEFALVKGKIGTLSVYGDYQAVFAEDFDDKMHFMHGPNGGIKVYLAKIAFPALAMGVSYNVTKNYAQFAAAMGVSM